MQSCCATESRCKLGSKEPETELRLAAHVMANAWQVLLIQSDESATISRARTETEVLTIYVQQRKCRKAEQLESWV